MNYVSIFEKFVFPIAICMVVLYFCFWLVKRTLDQQDGIVANANRERERWTGIIEKHTENANKLGISIDILTKKLQDHVELNTKEHDKVIEFLRSNKI